MKQVNVDNFRYRYEEPVYDSVFVIRTYINPGSGSLGLLSDSCFDDFHKFTINRS